MAIIYCCTHMASGKCYVGFSKKSTYGPRKKAHIKLSQRLRPKTVFHRALRKYTPAAFEWTVLDRHPDPEHTLRVLEPYWIKEKNAMVPQGYCMIPGGAGTWKGVSRSKRRFKSPMAMLKAMTKKKRKRKP